MRRPILNHTESGALIYDPFLGSGSVLIAAEQTGRVCAGVDIEPGYVDTAVRRWQELTGGEAVLEGNGRSFEQVRAERLRETGDSRPCLEPADRSVV
jgi:DNA modification methylase